MADYSDTLEDDYRAVDVLETITLRTYTESDPTGTTDTIEDVPTDDVEYVSEEGKVVIRTAFYVGADQLSAAQKPKTGDEITKGSDSSVWEIKNVTLVNGDSLWRCETVKQR